MAPNATRKLCSVTISNCLGPSLQRHFGAGSVAQLQGEMRDANVTWIPKPDKPPVSVRSLRPIGLMPLCATAVAGPVAKQIMVHLRPFLDLLPQYAYCPGRGCQDALLKAHQHFEEVEMLHNSHRGARYLFRTTSQEGQITTTGNKARAPPGTYIVVEFQHQCSRGPRPSARPELASKGVHVVRR